MGKAEKAGRNLSVDKIFGPFLWYIYTFEKQLVADSNKKKQANTSLTKGSIDGNSDSRFKQEHRYVYVRFYNVFSNLDSNQNLKWKKGLNIFEQ